MIKKIFTRIVVPLISLFIILCIVFLILVKIPLSELTEPQHTEKPVLIKNAFIVDAKADTILNRSLLIQAGKIIRIKEPGIIPYTSETLVIDASGKYLIPGLWDMHVHVSSSLAPLFDFPLFLANGVMNIRDMGGYASYETKKNWDSQIRDNQLIGPRFQGITNLFVYSLKNEVQAKQIINSFSGDSLDFIKIYNALLPEPFFSLMNEAHSKSITVLGHKPRSVSTIDASNAGMKSFEHARLFLFESFPGAQELRKKYEAYYNGEIDERPDNPEGLQIMLDNFKQDMFNEIVDTLIENKTWFIPTHLTRKLDAFAGDEDYLNDSRLMFMSFIKRMEWSRDAKEVFLSSHNSAFEKTYTEFYAKGLELTGKAHAKGLKILAGTDANDTYSFPGFSIHDELRELVKAGLTPSEALQAATILPAEYFSLSNSYGTLEINKIADIVILDKNPLEDISNTKTINTILFSGNVYSKTELNDLLNTVQKNSTSWSLNTKLIWDEME